MKRAGSNLAKYTSKNPLSRHLNTRFLATISDLTLATRPAAVLDAGCGEGFVIARLMNLGSDLAVTGLDIDDEALEYARGLNKGVPFVKGSVYELQFDDGSFDVVILSEVLEHLEDPQRALAEVERVSRGHVVISVPNEPIWRLGNMARLAYLGSLGNTPGHINHWSKKRFLEMITQVFDVAQVRTPFPWVAALCKKK